MLLSNFKKALKRYACVSVYLSWAYSLNFGSERLRPWPAQGQLFGSLFLRCVRWHRSVRQSVGGQTE